MTAAMFAASAMLGLGVVILVAATFAPQHLTSPQEPKRERFRMTTSVDRVPARVLWAVVLGVGVGAITRWPVAAIGAASAGAFLPSYRNAARMRRAALIRTEAVASWIEMVRDTMAGAAGLNEAIATSARVAPEAIREPVQALAARAEHQPLAVALRRFAADLDDPIGDSVAAALILTVQHQAGNLGPILSQIASNARDQAAMRQRVEASRAKTYVSVQFIVAVTIAFAFGLIVFARDYLAPFDSAVGQLALALVFGLFGASAWSVQKLGAPATTARLIGPGLADR